MKKFFKLLATGIACIIPSLIFAQSTTGDIKATILDEQGAPMPGAIVIITTGGSQNGGASDMDGNVTFRALTPGSYDLQARMLNYKVYTKKAVVVNPGETAYTTFYMQMTDNDSEIVIYDVKSPVSPTFSTIQNINADQVKHMAADRGNVLSMVSGSNSQVSEGANGGLVMRGARENASAMYVDGEVMYGSIGIPGGSIEQISVLSGGIPAAYGDVTGGIIIVTTKSYWTGASAKEAMYEADAEKKAALKKLMLERSGQHIEDKNTIIEDGSTPNAPAVDGQPK